MGRTTNLTPRQIVEKLDQYIIGQKDAKKAVAVALRNRYRRDLLNEKLRDEIIPKNILMIGPTGVGKTEIARRIAKIVGAPFIKVEATKFTEVGYVGRDVESMVRDLAETSVRLVKEDRMLSVKEQAEDNANSRLIDLLVPSAKKANNYKNPFEMLFGGGNSSTEQETSQEDYSVHEKRKIVKEKLALGQLENEIVTVEVEEQTPSMFDMLQGSGIEQMGMNMQDALSSFMPKKRKKRKLTVREARKVLTNEEAKSLLIWMKLHRKQFIELSKTELSLLMKLIRLPVRSWGFHCRCIQRRGSKGYLTGCRRFNCRNKIWYG